MDAITVCVNYSDKLKFCLGNKKYFDRWIIVTTKDDYETINLCKDNNLIYCFSDRIYESGPFCKGKAINDGLEILKPKEWVCLVDADTILVGLENCPSFINPSLYADEDCLYGVQGRIKINKISDIGNVNVNSLDHPWLVGYFQMWNIKCKNKYSEKSHNAGLDDVLFRDSFHDKRLLSAYCYHLGEYFKDHDGKKNIG